MTLLLNATMCGVAPAAMSAAVLSAGQQIWAMGSLSGECWCANQSASRRISQMAAQAARQWPAWLPKRPPLANLKAFCHKHRDDTMVQPVSRQVLSALRHCSKNSSSKPLFDVVSAGTLYITVQNTGNVVNQLQIGAPGCCVSNGTANLCGFAQNGVTVSGLQNASMPVGSSTTFLFTVGTLHPRSRMQTKPQQAICKQHLQAQWQLALTSS